MNKNTALFVCAILSAMTIYAQEESSEVKKFRFGLKATPSLSWFKPDVKGVEQAGVKLGFNYGLMTDFALGGNKNYAFATGFEVSNIGGKVEYPSVIVIDSSDYYGTTVRSHNLRYVNLPLQLKFKTNEIGYITYYGHFGFEAGVNIKAIGDDEHTLRKKEGGADVSSPITSVESDLDINKDVGLFRTALVVGAGIEYNLVGNTSVMAGLSFNNGFSNTFARKLKGYEKSVSYEGPALDNAGMDTGKNVKMKAISNYVALNIGIFF